MKILSKSLYLAVCHRTIVLGVALMFLTAACSVYGGSADESKGQHDFDFNFGTWKTHVKRLTHPLTGSTVWVDYDGTSIVTKVWNGRASLFQLDVNGPDAHIEGAGLRLYNPEAQQWSLNWANASVAVLDPPMIGGFKEGRGEFYGRQDIDGRSILVRNIFVDIKPNSSRFEQAFSIDGGKVWETNWIMTFSK